MAILAYDDVMLREPRLLVPGMQPLGPVRIDWQNQLTRGLCFCLPCTDGRELISGNSITWAGTGKIGTEGGRGKALIGNTSAATGSIPFSPRAATQEIAVGCWMYINGTPNADDVILETSENFGAKTGRFLFIVAETGAATTMGFWLGTSSGSYFNGVRCTRPADGRWYKVLINSDLYASFEPSIYIDGTPQAVTKPLDNASGSDYVTADTLYLLSRANTSLYAGAYLQQLCIWNRKLTAAESLAWSADTSQFLIPA